MWEILSILRVAFCKASKSVINMSRRHQMLSFACISLVLRCENRMQVQSHIHSRFPKSKKPKNSKNHIFCIFSWYKFVTVSGKALWKALKRSKTGLPGIKCCQSLVILPVFNREIEYEVKITFTTISQCQKNRKNSKNHCFWPFLTIPRDFI